MASTVLNGTGHFSYTNSTGQNVRVIIYGLLVSWGAGRVTSFAGETFYITAGNASFYTYLQPGVTNAAVWFGKGLAAAASNDAPTPVYNIGPNALAYASNLDIVAAMPTEYMLAPGQTISSSSTPSLYTPTISYNILVIPENG